MEGRLIVNNSTKISNFLAIALMCGIIFVNPSMAYGIQGLPGSTWWQLSYDSDGLTGSGIMGNINQGVDWLILPGGITLNTFAEYRYRTRTRNQLYYDAEGPALGVDFRKSAFRWGVDYYWQRFPQLNESINNREYYFSWYYDWDVKPADNAGLLRPMSLPGSTWGRLAYDINELNGSVAQGFVNQGADWLMLPGGITLNTFAEYRYRARTRNQLYYDAEGPALGVDFRKSVFRWGVNYYWERFPQLNEVSNKFQFYLTLFYDWELINR